MKYRVISLPTLRLARLFRLVKTFGPEAVKLDGRQRWLIRVEGRGFVRYLQHDLLLGPPLIQHVSAFIPHPIEFHSRTAVLSYLRNAGLQRVVPALPHCR